MCKLLLKAMAYSTDYIIKNKPIKILQKKEKQNPNGTLHSFVYNQHGQLGLGTKMFLPETTNSKINQLSCGNQFTFCADHVVW